MLLIDKISIDQNGKEYDQVYLLMWLKDNAFDGGSDY